MRKGKRWKKNKDKVNHRLREAWRWKEWTKAGQKETKVGKLISKVPYHQDLYKRAKKWIQIPERKCLLAAGFTSPAELKMNRNAPPNWPTTCPWCGKEPGRTLHMLWECKSRPHGGPTRPKCELQARLGWTAEGTDNEADKVIKWIQRMAQEVWDKRYKDENEKREKSEKAKDDRYWDEVRNEGESRTREGQDQDVKDQPGDWSEDEDEEEEGEENEAENGEGQSEGEAAPQSC